MSHLLSSLQSSGSRGGARPGPPAFPILGLSSWLSVWSSSASLWRQLGRVFLRGTEPAEDSARISAPARSSLSRGGDDAAQHAARTSPIPSFPGPVVLA